MSEIEALRAENARLRAALKPFAKAMNAFEPEFAQGADARPVTCETRAKGLAVSTDIKLGHFRAARAALGGPHA